MEENENKLEKAVEALKNEQIPPGPPQELADSTIAKLISPFFFQDPLKVAKR